MAMRWEDIVIRTADNKAFGGSAARSWVGRQDGALLPGEQHLKSRLVLTVHGAKLFDDDALEYLRGRFVATIEYRQRLTGGARGRRGLNRQHNNTLVGAPPRYAITLSLGDIDALFDEVADDAARPWRRVGVQQRLQALGYLYTPLRHSKIIQHAQLCWEYYKRVHTPAGGAAPSDAAAVGLLKREVQNNLITGAFPTSGQILGAGALPAAGAFAALRFPGGYCFTRSAGGRMGQYTMHGAHNPGDNQYDFEIGNDRFAIEAILRRDNPKLGRFPILARVERVWPDGRRTPVGDAPVHFQLHSPDDPAGTPFAADDTRDTTMDYAKDPSLLTAARPNSFAQHKGLTVPEWASVQAAANQALLLPVGAARTNFMAQPVPGVAPTKQANAGLILQSMVTSAGPPYEVAAAGPRAMITTVLGNATHGVAPTDPQRGNCPHAHGGKQGQAAAGHVWELPTVDEPGFHIDGRGRRALGTLARVTASTGPANADAVRCVSNAEGHAGAIFAPSSVAGDRYRIRAHVDAQWLQAHRVNNTVEALSGTLVVWRNIRMHRYVQKTTTTRAQYSAAVNALFDYPHNNPLAGQDCQYFGDAGFARMHIESPVSDLAVLPGAALEAPYPAVLRGALVGNGRYPKMYRPIAHQFIGFEQQLKQHYCELLDDSGGRETMTSGELSRALARGREVVAASGLVTTPIDWPTLVFHDMTSPFLITWRSFAEYNALKQPLFPALNPNDATLTDQLTTASNLMVEVVCEFFAGGGVLPGLTLLQVPRGESWDFRALNGPANITSGYGIPCRTAIVSHTDRVYRDEFFIYSATSNAIHELGHVLSLPHQPDVPGGPVEMHELQVANAYTTPAAGEVNCVMSYVGCYGEYCGRCGLSLRGWRVQSPSNPGGV